MEGLIADCWFEPSGKLRWAPGYSDAINIYGCVKRLAIKTVSGWKPIIDGWAVLESENVSARLPKCSHLCIRLNDHKDRHMSVQEWEIEFVDMNGHSPFATPDDRLEAMETDTLWVLEWFPKAGEGSRLVAASTLERLLVCGNDAEADAETVSGR